MKLYDDQLFLLVDAIRQIKNISQKSQSFYIKWEKYLINHFLNLLILNDQDILEFGYYKLTSILYRLEKNCFTSADHDAKIFLEQICSKLAPLIFTIQK